LTLICSFSGLTPPTLVKLGLHVRPNMGYSEDKFHCNPIGIRVLGPILVSVVHLGNFAAHPDFSKTLHF